MPKFANYNLVGELDFDSPLYEHLDRFNIDEIDEKELFERLSEGLPEEVYLVLNEERINIPEAYGWGTIEFELDDNGLLKNQGSIKADPFMIFPGLLVSNFEFQAGEHVLYAAPEQDMLTKIKLGLGEY